AAARQLLVREDDALAARRGELQPLPTPVVFGALSLDEPQLLEGSEQAAHGGTGDAEHALQLALVHAGAMRQERIEQVEAGGGEAHLPEHRASDAKGGL